MKKLVMLLVVAVMMTACASNEVDKSLDKSLDMSTKLVVSDITVTPTVTPSPSPTLTPTPTVVPTVTPTPEPVELVVEEIVEPTIEPVILSTLDLINNPTKPVNMILDMDFCSDIDDVCALRIATSLAKQGKINLIATGNCVDGDYSCRGMHTILSYDGFPDVPIGMARRGIELDHNYLDGLVSRCDTSTYHKQDCVDVYKEAIKQCSLKNEKARIVTTGFLVNIEDLLTDPEGYELVRHWVDSIWIVGGTYPFEDKDFNFYWTEDAVKSIQYVNANSPIPIVYITNSSGCDYSTGKIVMCGWGLRALDPDLNDPVTLAFDEFERSYSGDSSGGNAAWDGLAVYTAAVSREESQTYLATTDVEILDNGTSIFYPNEKGKHAMLERYLDVNQYSDIMDSLMKLYMK